jgi:hypothetical protein
VAWQMATWWTERQWRKVKAWRRKAIIDPMWLWAREQIVRMQVLASWCALDLSAAHLTCHLWPLILNSPLDFFYAIVFCQGNWTVLSDELVIGQVTEPLPVVHGDAWGHKWIASAGTTEKCVKNDSQNAGKSRFLIILAIRMLDLHDVENN